MPDAAKKTLADLIAVMAALRTPVTGCPWDLEQSFATIAPYTIEEAYEVADAIERGDRVDLAEELGDLLLQVVYHARLAEEEQAFDFADVVHGITTKMIRRHPHVFGDVIVDGADQVMSNWEQIKSAERASGAPRPRASSSVDGVPGHLPALTFANELAKKAAKIGFDWSDSRQTLDKVHEELAEVTESWDDPEHLAEELGDLLFATVNVARHCKVDPEVALRQASAKFRRRVQGIEALAAERGIDLAAAGPAVLDDLWVAVKAGERAS